LSVFPWGRRGKGARRLREPVRRALPPRGLGGWPSGLSGLPVGSDSQFWHRLASGSYRRFSPTPPITRLLIKAEAFRCCRRGVGAVEYALLIGMIASSIVILIGRLGGSVARMECGVSSVLYNIASNAGFAGSSSSCATLADGAAVGSGDTCSGQPVGATCQRLNAAGGLDTVVVVTMNSFYAWPSDESSTHSWNDGSATYVEVLGDSGSTSDTAGMSETNTLVGLGLSPSPAPYAAAQACRAHGPDWYLPAMGELHTMLTAAGQNGVGALSFNSSGSYPPGYYSSASEYSSCCYHTMNIRNRS